jgi:hypothetical protein
VSSWETTAATYTWRCWLAFEVRPGITATRNLGSHWRALAESCRGADGRIDGSVFEFWMDMILDHSHTSGEA